MQYFSLFDCWGRRITAYEETWTHATTGHPELVGNERIVMTCLVVPEELKQSDTGTDTKLYIGPPIASGLHAGETPVSVVRYEKQNTGVWVTGYFTSLPGTQKTLWKKS
jgi:hypothetical protein